MTVNDAHTAIIPAPVRLETGEGLVSLGRVRVSATFGDGVDALATELLGPAGVDVVPSHDDDASADGPPPLLDLRIDPTAGPRGSSNPERYTLRVAADGVAVAAPGRIGLLHGLRTLRQLAGAAQAAGHPGEVPTVVVHDEPRHAWRGLSLDIARHFFGPAHLRAVVDLLGHYKMNRLGLHLTDDQGWRLEIPSRPELVARSSQSAVDGDPGGYLSVRDFEELQDYAAEREIVVVPEIDLPGHVNAATHAYGELTPSGEPTDVYQGIEVGFSRLHLDLPTTEPFLRDVLGDVARMTRGPWVHFGGDEVHAMESKEYLAFVALCQEIVTASGKTPAAWQEAAGAGHGDAAAAATVLADATGAAATSTDATGTSATGPSTTGADAAGTSAAGAAQADGSTAGAAATDASARSDDAAEATAVVPAESPVLPGTVLVYWDPRAEPDAFLRAARAGGRFVMAPAAHAYLDMKYTPEHPLGLHWAGSVELRDSYDWDAESLIDQLPASAIAGVSACVWTETLVTRDDLFSMLLPRLAAVAETAWTPASGKDWRSFRARVATEAAAWRRDGTAFHPTPQVDW